MINIIIALLVIATAALAQPVLVVDPMEYEFELPHGNQLTSSINVSNDGDESLIYDITQERANREILIRAIMLTYRSEGRTVENIRNAIEGMDVDVWITYLEHNDPEQIRELLAESNVLILPGGINDYYDYFFDLGGELGDDLETFCFERGGVIVGLDNQFNNTAAFLAGTGMLSIENADWQWDLSFEITTLHPVSIGVSEFTTIAQSSMHTPRERSAQVLSREVDDGRGNITVRSIGKGGIAYLGVDGSFFNPTLVTITRNAVMWSRGASTWLIIDENYQHELAPGFSEDIIFDVLSTFTPSPGIYRRNLIFNSNDPQSETIRIPLELTVGLPQKYDVWVEPREIFVISPPNQDSTVIVQLRNDGDGVFEANVSLADTSLQWLTLNTNRLTIDKNVRERLVLSFIAEHASNVVERNWIQFRNVVTDSLMLELNVLYYANDEFGALEGRVIDSFNGAGIRDVTVNLQGIRITTDESGYFENDLIPPMRYNAVITHPDYLPTSAQANIQRFMTTRLNEALSFARIEMDVDSVIAVTIHKDSMFVINGTISNTGTGRFDYDIEFKDLNPFQQLRYWDYRWEAEAADQVGVTQFSGVVFNGENFFLSGASGFDRQIYTMNTDGEIIDSFPQLEAHPRGIADLAWDGNFIYGTGRRELIGYNEFGEIMTRIPSPLLYNAGIAFDRSNQLFWGVEATSEIYGYDRDGNIIYTIPNPGKSVTGLAWQNFRNDGFNLFAFCRGGVVNSQVFNINPETGEWHYLLDLATGAEEQSGGLSITSRWDWRHDTIILQTMGRNSRTILHNLSPWPDWVRVSPSSGSILPGRSESIEIVFDANGFSDEQHLEGLLIIDGHQQGGPDTISVSMLASESSVPWEDGSDLMPTSLTLSAYPNPFNGQLNVKYSGIYLKYAVIALHDLQGRVVKNITLTNLNSPRGSVLIDAHHLPTGMYLLSIKTAHESRSMKVVYLK